MFDLCISGDYDDKIHICLQAKGWTIHWAYQWWKKCRYFLKTPCDLQHMLQAAAPFHTPFFISFYHNPKETRLTKRMYYLTHMQNNHFLHVTENLIQNTYGDCDSWPLSTTLTFVSDVSDCLSMAQPQPRFMPIAKLGLKWQLKHIPCPLM